MGDSSDFGSAELPSAKLEKNVCYIKNIFKGDDTIDYRCIKNNSGKGTDFCLIYADGMVNNKLVNDDIVCPLMKCRLPEDSGGLMETLLQNVIFSDSIQRTAKIDGIIQAVEYGDTVLLAEGCSDSLILNTKGYSTRSIEEPESERVLRGPREGFNESLLVNLSMLRRKLHTSDLKMQYRVFGRKTKTKACVCYLGSVADKNVVDEMGRRLDRIDIDGTLDTEYLAELICDGRHMMLDTVGSTERPDVVAGKLLEGRIAILLDGTPQAITLPYLFVESFQSDEDYYLNYVFASIGRFLRILSFIISTTLPGVYIALVTLHPEILPTPLFVSIIQSRQGVPFPTTLEMMIMLIVFELLRESGTRMPGVIGQMLGVVGAIVIGNAAVEAKIVSAPIIIIMALAGITGMMNPKIKGFTILTRTVIIILSATFGMYGLLFGNVALLIYLYNVTSFGVPVMQSVHIEKFQEIKDIAFRAPWNKMIKRPSKLTKNTTRQKQGGAGK